MTNSYSTPESPVPGLFDDLHRIPSRLSAEDEVFLARTIEAGVLARPTADVSPVEVAMLQARGQLAHELFITANLGLVAWVIARERPDRLDHDDLFQEGVLGLDRAVRGFDHRLGTFAGYAIGWIKESVMTAKARAQERTVRWLRESQRIRYAEDQLTQQLGRVVGPTELAQHFDRPVDWVTERANRLTPIPADHAWLEHVAEEPQHRSDLPDLANLLDSLGVLPRLVIERRFGIGLPHPQSRPQVAASLGLTGQQVRRLEHEALDELRSICPHQLRDHLVA